MNDKHHSLFELQNQVKNSLENTFSLPVWVIAEISEMTVNRSGHCYLDLVETEPGTDQVIARCRATIWSYTFRMLRPYFETTTGQAFSEGLKVLLQAKVEYHEVYGFSLNIRDIDPVYTLGDLARQRREIIRKLQEDGVFEMNKELELPVVPQRIAVISSPTAAGFQDFTDQLHNNPHQFVFYTKLFPAVMQGNEAPRSIMDALERIYEYEDLFDAVVIIRGGGAQLDLACFDQYELAFYVAQFPLPVITGIGHDKDDTVVDLVAHTRMKTPTAVAEFLIAGALRFSQELKELEQQFIELITDQLDSKKSRLSEIAGQLNVLVNKMIVAQQNRLEITGIQLSNHSQSYLKVQQSDIRQKLVETKNRTERFVAKQNHRLDYSGNKLNYSFREQTLKNKNLLNRFEHLIRIQALEIIRSEKKNLNAVAEKLRLVDPMNVLKRGYSLTMVEGKILKSVKQISIGDKLETRMSDGTIESTIEKISNKE
jgi:exodeoxyribonuclease VII large subunit